MTVNEQANNEEKLLAAEKSVSEIDSKSPRVSNDPTKSGMAEPKKAELPKMRLYYLLQLKLRQRSRQRRNS